MGSFDNIQRKQTTHPPSLVQRVADQANQVKRQVENLAAEAGIHSFKDTVSLASSAVHIGYAEVVDRVKAKLEGPPQGPFPSMLDLQRKFPQAGLPDRMMGTTLDDALMNDPHADPDALMAKIAAMGMNTVRLGAYWDQIEPKGPGDADFAKLDAYLAAAQRHGIKVVLSVGAKGPNWPEYHVPSWAKPKGESVPSQDARFRGQSEDFVRKVAEHVADNPAVVMWQVENEPFDPAGPDKMRLDQGMVAEEAAILRQADGHRRPVMINCWSDADRRPMIDQAFQLADLVGLDVYKRTPAPGEYPRTVGTPSYALELAKKTGKPAMIAELQADDWGSYRTNSQDVSDLTHHLEQLGYENFLFWRLDMNVTRERQGDNSLTETEAQLTHEALQQGR
ncbi:MAG TPA: beta-galactosidase [Stenomitos sp.]